MAQASRFLKRQRLTEIDRVVTAKPSWSAKLSGGLEG